MNPSLVLSYVSFSERKEFQSIPFHVAPIGSIPFHIVYAIIIFSSLKSYFDCIVDKLFDGDEGDEMKRCLGDVQLFIEKRREMLLDIFPVLATVKVQDCLGKDCMTPL